MKLTTTTMLTVDGVMQGLGGPDEDRRGGFERGGWVRPYADNEAMAFLNEVYGRADAFLFGRRTYEIFADSWGTWPDPGNSPIWTALNTRPKYVASTTPFGPKWANTTVLSGDAAAAIRELKAKAGGELQIRVGVHVGEIETVRDDVTGVSVNVAARVAAMAGPSEILVSSTVKDLTPGSGLSFEDAGEHELKGVPDRWRLYRVVS
jgi:class 3 adenylate cyclase